LHAVVFGFVDGPEVQERGAVLHREVGREVGSPGGLNFGHGSTLAAGEAQGNDTPETLRAQCVDGGLGTRGVRRRHIVQPRRSIVQPLRFIAELLRFIVDESRWPEERGPFVGQRPCFIADEQRSLGQPRLWLGDEQGWLDQPPHLVDDKERWLADPSGFIGLPLRFIVDGPRWLTGERRWLRASDCGTWGVTAVRAR
jgi:hypothetical protein